MYVLHDEQSFVNEIRTQNLVRLEFIFIHNYLWLDGQRWVMYISHYFHHLKWHEAGVFEMRPLA